MEYDPTPVTEEFVFTNFDCTKSNYFLAIYKKNNGESMIMEHVVKILAEEYQGKLAFYKTFFDESKKIRKLYKLELAPSFILMINGKPMEIIQGLASYSDLKILIEKYIK